MTERQDARAVHAGSYDVEVHKVGGKHPGGKPVAIGRWTFETPVVRRVVEDALHGRVLNATAGKTRLNHGGGDIIRNDINPERDADHHFDVCKIDEHFAADSFDTVVFDPPFDQGQADEHYDGMHASDINEARQALAELVRPGGTLVELGWNSHGAEAYSGWTREALHLFQRGPCLQDVILVIDRNEQTRLVPDGGETRQRRLYRPQPTPDPVVIPMEEQHVETAAHLWKTRFGATPDNMKAWFRDVLTEGKPTEGFVASDGGNVLGFGIATICGPDYVEDYIGHPDVDFEGWEKTGLLHIIAVDEDYEGRGLGSELVEARLRWLAIEGVNGAFGVSWHREGHRDSRALFEKYGFEVVATVENYYAEKDNPETECVDCDGVCECDATIYAREVGGDE